MCKFYTAMHQEAISEEDWLHSDIGHDINVWLAKWLHQPRLQYISGVRKLNKTAFAFYLFDTLYAL